MLQKLSLLGSGLLLLTLSTGCACYRCTCYGILSNQPRDVYITGNPATPPQMATGCQPTERAGYCDTTPCHTGACKLIGEDCSPGSTSATDVPEPDPLNAD